MKHNTLIKDKVPQVKEQESTCGAPKKDDNISGATTKKNAKANGVNKESGGDPTIENVMEDYK